MRPNELIRELRRRRVFRAAGYYIVVAWVTVQVADLFFPGINVPESAILFVWLTAAFLFPLFVIFAWFFDLTPQGVVRTAPVQPGEEFDTSLRRLDYILLAALTITAAAITLEFSSRIEGTSDIGGDNINPFSIAVLPLDNIVGDPEQQYFVSGMQAALIAGLSRIRALRVTSKTSTLQYRDARTSLADIGRQLGVAKIVEGSVLRTGNRVRISVQLLDAQADEHVWSATFEDDLEDIMILQGKVAQEIAGQVRVTLSEDERAQFESVDSVNAGAYEAILKGIFHVEQFNPGDIQLAAGYFEQAVEFDPDYALGYWGLGKLCLFKAQTGMITPSDAREQCLPPFLRALDLDPLLPEAHMGYASTLTWQHFDWKAAGKAFERAIELNPSYADAHLFYSHYLGIVGELEKSSEHMRSALELDPMNPFVRGLSGVQLLMIKEYEKAIKVAEEVLQSSPGIGFGYGTLSMAHHYLGNKGQALQAESDNFRYMLGRPESADELESLYPELGYEASMIRLADSLVVQRQTGHVGAGIIATLYDYGGDHEQAIDWIEIVFEEQGPSAPYHGVLMHTAEIAGHPRFQKILRDYKLDYWADEYERQYGNMDESPAPEIE